MKKLLILLVVTSNPYLAQCFSVNFANDTERSRRSIDNMGKIIFNNYNEYIESKSGGKAFCFLSELPISSAQLLMLHNVLV
jgi:hypothetical protein